jgi:hypothetical protein
MSTDFESLRPVGTDDYVAISRLIHRYADAVVHRRGDLWGSCWAHDAVWDLGRGRLVEGREAITALWYSAMEGMASVVQTVQNGEAWVAAEDTDPEHPTVAMGRWYISERFRRADGTRGILLAHYDDRYVKREGAWLLAGRVLQPHYMGAPDLSGDFLNSRESLSGRGVPSDV